MLRIIKNKTLLPSLLRVPCLRDLVTDFQPKSTIGVWERSYSSDNAKSSCSHTNPEISQLGFSKDLLEFLQDRDSNELLLHIKKLKPIQREVFPWAMQGRDIIGIASKGAGKTLAYGLPIIDKNRKHGRGIAVSPPYTAYPLALVLSPTPELALNVHEYFCRSVYTVGAGTVCVDGVIHNGVYFDPDFCKEIEMMLAFGSDIVVGTPSRVNEVLEEEQTNISDVHVVVLDDVDLMVDEGMDKMVENILGKLLQKPQVMIFGASLPDWICKLGENYLDNPFKAHLP